MRLLTLALALFITSAAQAQASSYINTARAQSLPAEECTAETKVWLATAFVAEAGWEENTDHRAIFHVLKRRWPMLKKRFPKTYPHFLNVVQRYVAAFDPRTEKGGRVRWLTSLATRPDRMPIGWSEKLSWPKHKKMWKVALLTSELCILGGCRDPYRGRALHWGGTMDKPRGCMQELPNAGTLNTFYSVDQICRRRRNRDE